MRFVSLIPAIPAVAALFLSASAHAQAWEEYVNRSDFFTVNFPGEPADKEITYKTAKGTSLPAHVYTAQDANGSSYSITVVDYSGATDEGPTAIEEAAKTIRALGTVKYEGVNMLDMHRSWRMTVETPAQRRILGEILVSAANRLYISQADTALDAAPPAQFQASLGVLDANGFKIRNRTVEGATPDEVVPVTPQQRAIDVARNEALVQGTWRNANGGSCEVAFYKAGERSKTKRGEDSMVGTVTNAGITLTGQLIIQGPRVGQFINPTTDMVIMLFDPSPGKIVFSGLIEPTAGWGDVTLAPCQG
jgi:hypothetical protein